MAQTDFTLAISGMTCAACAARVEQQLNRVAGASANVNLATETAHVRAPAGSAQTLVTTVAKLGYTATVLDDGSHGFSAADRVKAKQLRDALAFTHTKNLLHRTLVAAVFTLPVIVISMLPALQFDYWTWVVAALATPVVFWAGYPLHKAAFFNAKHGVATMDTLISVGTAVAYLWSLVALVWGTAGNAGARHTLNLGELWHGLTGLWQTDATHIHTENALSQVYFEVAAGVIFFVLLGRFIELRAKQLSGTTIANLYQLLPQTVTLVTDGKQRYIPISELKAGDVFVVTPGTQIAADGVVLAGSTELDLALLSGESAPVAVQIGDQVTAGALNTTGSITVRATAVGADTRVAQMQRVVQQAQAEKSQFQRLADRISAVFVPCVFALAAITLVTWLLLTGDVTRALTAALAVLIIACPCALGLATPIALLVAVGRGAQLGALLSGPVALERAAHLNAVVFDKTGTLTVGKPSVTAVCTNNDTDPQLLLQIAAALEQQSEHPLARAIVAHAPTAAHSMQVTNFQSQPGKGVVALVHLPTSFLPVKAILGNFAMFAAEHYTVPESVQKNAERLQESGNTVVLVGWYGRAQGVIALQDKLRPESAAVISELRNLGLEPHLLTGDGKHVAQQVAQKLGIKHTIAQALPETKLAYIQKLQHGGASVVMIGDGINDAPALAQADLGIALATGTSIAQSAADITLVRDGLAAAPAALRLARRTRSAIKTNLFWAFAYNTLALPVAAFGLLNPMLAGLAMAASSLFVVGNSLLLRFQK